MIRLPFVVALSLSQSLGEMRKRTTSHNQHTLIADLSGKSCENVRDVALSVNMKVIPLSWKEIQVDNTAEPGTWAFVYSCIVSQLQISPTIKDERAIV